MIKKKLEPDKTPPVSISFGADRLKLIDDEMWLRKVRNRSEMVRTLVDEALWRAATRRRSGKPVEVGQ